MKPLSPIDPSDVERWVASQLDGLFSGDPVRSAAFVGGQTAADAALATLDIAGYARRRSVVDPVGARGASKLSPFIRHGLIDLPTAHDHPAVADADSSDRFRYRSELLWQEYSRHWYAVFGRQTRAGVAYRPTPGRTAIPWGRDPWPTEMECVDTTTRELHRDGWIVNQTRMWLASQWSVRAGAEWRDGEDEMFRHLLDGSRAANRQGWQWVVGGARSRTYGFARPQVTKRAPAYCERCRLRDSCPIDSYPESVASETVDPRPTMSPELLGPTAPHEHAEQQVLEPTNHAPAAPVEAVWITAESLGDADPALSEYPDLPVHFVFDEPLLRSLRLDGKRLVFLADSLADLARRRDVHVWRGRPADLLRGRHADHDGLTFVVTRAPVPGFSSIVERSGRTPAMAPWRWLRPPTPALLERLTRRRFPSFTDWCRLTEPDRS